MYIGQRMVIVQYLYGSMNATAGNKGVIPEDLYMQQSLCY